MASLDDVAGDFFRSIREIQTDLNTDRPKRDIDTFILVSGQVLQLWILKLLWGAVASQSVGVSGTPLASMRRDTDLRDLSEILWRGSRWPQRWGLYSRPHDIDPSGTPDSVGILPLSFDGELWGGTVQFGALELSLALGSPDPPAVPQPGSFVFHRSGSPVEKVIAFAWPEPGHPTVKYRRQA
ncbi:hypothetical protein GCM10010198_67800 [Nocardia seriolae]